MGWEQEKFGYVGIAIGGLHEKPWIYQIVKEINNMLLISEIFREIIARLWGDISYIIR